VISVVFRNPPDPTIGLIWKIILLALIVYHILRRRERRRP
jgi:hypothetical protein